MNEQLQKELAAWLSKLREAADAGGSFVLEQAPLIVQEKVAYGRVVETTWLVGLLVIVALGIFATIRMWKWASKNWSGYEGEGVIAAAALGTCACCGLPGFLALMQFQATAKVWFAPRLYVLEWLAGLLK